MTANTKIGIRASGAYRLLKKQKQKKTMEKEIWKDVLNYEGLYQVSNLGNIKRNGKIRKTPLNKNGYKIVSLSKHGKIKVFLAHRIVASSFCENKECKKEVNHIDGIKTNNNISNLEWCTSSENTIHAYKINLQTSNGVKGSESHFSRLKEHQVLEIKSRIKKNNEKLKDIAIDYGVSPSLISDIKRNKRWKHI